MTLLEFARQYSMPKTLGAEPTRKTRRIVVIPRPYVSSDPASDKYEQYCRQSLMQHQCFRQMDDLLSGYDNYIDAYAAFLQSGHIPPCLEDDMYRLMQHTQSTEDDTDDNSEVCAPIHLCIHIMRLYRVRYYDQCYTSRVAHSTTTTNSGVDADLPAECRPAAKHGHPGWDRLDPGCSLVPHPRGGSIIHFPAETSCWTACVHHLSQSCQPAGEAAAGVHHRPAAPVSQQSPTPEDDCLRHSWHREVLPHPLPPTSPAAPAAGCSSNWCGRLQHRWPDPPLPLQPAHQSRVQGPGGRETHQAAACLLRGEVSHH